MLFKVGYEYDHSKEDDPDCSGMYDPPDVFRRYAWIFPRQADSGVPANGTIEEYCRS